jgi:hypothetical protein
MFSETFAYGFPPRPYALAAHVALLNEEAPGAPWMTAGLGVDIRPLIPRRSSAEDTFAWVWRTRPSLAP